ncbi:MAG: DUF1330 domain-containing protein [Pseudomonadota bacterium]
MTTISAARFDQILADFQALGIDPLAFRDTWQVLSELPDEQPVTLINFFRFRDKAAYPKTYAGEDTNITGEEAFGRYAAVSGDCLKMAGGRFLLVAPFLRTFIGEAEEWHLTAIGTYPSADALARLFEQQDYREAYVHRLAACERERVSLVLG